MRKIIFSTLIILCVLVVAMPIMAGSEVGRYQAIPFRNDSIFIIDTKEGHIWLWKYFYSEGRRTYSLTYQSKVKPGDIINKENIIWDKPKKD